MLELAEVFTRDLYLDRLIGERRDSMPKVLPVETVNMLDECLLANVSLATEECQLVQFLQAMQMTGLGGKYPAEVCRSYLDVLDGSNNTLESFIAYAEDATGVTMTYDHNDLLYQGKYESLAHTYMTFFPLVEINSTGDALPLPLRRISDLPTPWSLSLLDHGDREAAAILADFGYRSDPGSSWQTNVLNKVILKTMGLVLDSKAETTVPTIGAVDHWAYPSDGGYRMQNYLKEYFGTNSGKCLGALPDLTASKVRKLCHDYQQGLEKDLTGHCEVYCRVLLHLKDHEEEAMSILESGLPNPKAEPTLKSPLLPKFPDFPLCNLGSGIEEQGCWSTQVTEWGLCYTSLSGMDILHGPIMTLNKSNVTILLHNRTWIFTSD